MRILHLDAGRGMRGGQWQALRLIEGLADLGVENTLLARGGGPLLELARERRVVAAPLGVLRIAALARTHDLVHVHDARSHTLAALAGGAPLVVSRRVAFPIRSSWKYARAKHYIAVSAFVKSVLMGGGIAEENITVIYDGVPLLTPSTGTGVLALANQEDAAKGASLAGEAARLAGVNLRFTAALEQDLQHAGVFLYLTHSEGLGSAVLLAMSAAVPVIASKTGGLTEIVRHRETGLLVENDAHAVAEALHEFMRNPEWALHLGEVGRRWVQERFSVETMASRTMEVYRQVLA
jgi:glycosyltransferase involved in cell wall biosynthesis